MRVGGNGLKQVEINGPNIAGNGHQRVSVPNVPKRTAKSAKTVPNYPSNRGKKCSGVGLQNMSQKVRGSVPDAVESLWHLGLGFEV